MPRKVTGGAPDAGPSTSATVHVTAPNTITLPTNNMVPFQPNGQKSIQVSRFL